MSQGKHFKLDNFFIFNPQFGKEEGEEEKKILYYYPTFIEKDVQIKSAGLCEAIIKFAASFHPEKPCEVVSTEKIKQVLFEPEPGFWMTMTISTDGFESKNNEDPSDNIVSNVYSSVLRLAYRMFHLFSNSFQSYIKNFNDENVLELKKALAAYYDNYLPQINIDTCNILDVFQGIQYLPLSREPFLHVQSFINAVEVEFPCIKYSAFLYNDHLVWSGIDPEDMQVLYQYLVKTLLPTHLDLELQGGSLPGSSPGSTVHYGSFVTGPAELMDQVVSSSQVPEVNIRSSGTFQKFHLVVYRALSATLCLLLPTQTELTLKLFKNFEEYIGPRLTSIVSEITECCVLNATTSSTEPTMKFIYFNRLNLAIKSSVFEMKKGSTSVVSAETMRILSSLSDDKNLNCDNGELLINTVNDTWIAVKSSNGREFYIVNQKKLGLRDITAEVKKICNTQLKGIFFLT